MSKKGFSLIEVLVVIAMIALIGIVITELFFRSFLGSNKASIVSNIKQNGQSALEQMDKTIRGAEKVLAVCPDPNPNTILIYKEGIYTRFRFNPPAPSVNPRENGYISSDNLSDCSALTPIDPAAVNILTDRNSSKGVSVTDGKFEFTRVPGFKDVVTITFHVGPAVYSGANMLSSIDPVEFKTTIELR